jgi:hypothetical protein
VHAEEIAEMTDQYSQRWYTTEELAELLKIDPSSVAYRRTVAGSAVHPCFRAQNHLQRRRRRSLAGPAPH